MRTPLACRGWMKASFHRPSRMTCAGSIPLDLRWWSRRSMSVTLKLMW
jgi:hypothetical protein